MPRSVRSQGRPNTAVIPADWGASHAPVVTRAMRARVALRKPGTIPGGWDEALQQTVATPHPTYWAGTARVQALSGEAAVVVDADDVEQVADFLVQVPYDAPASIAAGDLLTVVAPMPPDVAADATDPAQVGSVWQVTTVRTGSERFTRDLYCSHTT